MSLVAQPVAAATYTWNNSTDVWSNASAWSPAGPVVSDAANVLVFGGAGSATYRSTNDLTGATAADPFLLNQLQLNSTSSAAQFLLGNTLGFVRDEVAGLDPTITQTGSGAFTLLTKLRLLNDFTVNGAGTGAITLGRYGMSDVLSGSAKFTLNTAATQVTTIFGDNANFSGDITVTTGILAVGNRNALGTGTLSLAHSTGLRAAAGPTGKITNAVNINGTVTLGGGANPPSALDLAGPISLQVAAANVVRSLSTATGTETLISGVISNGPGTGAAGISKAGAGTLILSGANTYTNDTAVTAGTLRVTAGGRLGANLTGNDVTVSAGATLRLQAPGAIGNLQKLTVNSTATSYGVLGLGYDVLPSAIGSLDGVTATGSGVLALDGVRYSQALDQATLGDGTWLLGATNLGARFVGSSLAPDSTGVYRLGGGGGTLRITSAEVLTNIVDGDAVLQIGALNASGTAMTNSLGTVVIAAPQSYGGGTYVQSGTLVALLDDALGTYANLVVAVGTLDLRSSNVFGAVDAQYAARSINFTSATGGLTYGIYNGGFLPTIEFGDLYVDQTSTIAVTLPYALSIGNPLLRSTGTASFSGATTTFNIGTGAGLELAGEVSGNALTKTGAGRLILSNANNVSGLVSVTAGLLSLHDPDAVTTKLVVAAAGVELRADGTTSGDVIDFAAGGTEGIEVSGASSFNVDGLTGATRGNVINLNAPITITTTATTAASVTFYAGGAGAGGLSLIQGADALGTAFGAEYKLRFSGDVTLAGNGASVTLTTLGGRLEIFGDILETGGAKNLIKAGRNNVTLYGAGAYTGTTTVDRGALILKSDDALAGTSSISLGSAGGSSLTSWNTDLLLGAGITLNRDVAVNAVATVSPLGATASLGTLEAGISTYSGNIAVNRDVVQLQALLAAGTVRFTGTLSGNAVTKLGRGVAELDPISGLGNSFTGALSINAGTLRGFAQATSGSPLGANTAITINSGTLELVGRAATTTTSGHALSIAGGARLVVDATAGGSTTLALSGLTRSGIGTLTIVPITGTSETITATGLSTTSGIVAPWLVRQTSATDSTAGFVGVTSSTLVAGGYSATTDINLATNTTVYRATAGSTNTLAADAAVYALRSDGQTIGGADYTLTVGSGSGVAGLILNEGAAISVGRLNFGAAEGLIYVGGATTTTSTIGSSIQTTNANALTKFGVGTLVLTGASTYTGATTVNEGTLRTGADFVLPGGLLRSSYYGSTVNIGAAGTLDLAGFDQAIGGLAGEGTLLLGNGALFVGYGNATSTFSGQYVGGAASKIIKVGTGALTLLNNRVDLPNSLGELVVQQGRVNLRLHSTAWAGPLDLGAPFGESTLITLRGGTLDIRYAAEVGNSHQDIPFRNNIVVSANSTLSHDRLESDGTGSKTIEFADLSIGDQTLTTTGGSLHSFTFDELLLSGHAVINTGIGMGVEGAIHGGRTLTKIGNSHVLYLGGNSNATFTGGVVVNGGGLYFGERIGGMAKYSATANAGSGHVLVNPSANSAVRLASAANITGRLFVHSTASQVSRVELMADIDLATLGLNARGTGELGLGTSHWTTPIDLSLLGDGSWYLGAFLHNGEGSGTTLAVPFTTIYAADTLGPGKDDTYRFGGGNFGSYATGGYGVLAIQQANVLTGSASVVVGAALTTPNTFFSSTVIAGLPTIPSSTTGTLQLFADQDYTGKTTIYRGVTGSAAGMSTLDFRGTLATPAIEVLGTLYAAGNGRFTTDGLTNRNAVTLRPGSMLVLDFGLPTNTGTANLDGTASQASGGFTNKWGDDEILELNGAALDLVNAPGLQSHEYVKQIRLRTGADIRVRGNGTNGGMTLFLGDAFDRIGLATVSISTGSATVGLGAASGIFGRVIFSDAADAPARGVVGSTTVNMVAPWLVGHVGNTFLDYDPVYGFQPVTSTSSTGATFNPGADNGTSIIDATFTAAQTHTNTGTRNIYALRIGNQAAATAAVTLTGGQINVHSGGLITQAGANATGAVAQTITIESNLYFGNGTTRTDAYIYLGSQSIFNEVPAANTTNITGAITAANLVKSGPGLLNISGANSFTGKVQVNGGTLRVTGATAAGGATEFLLGGSNAALGASVSTGNPTFVTLDLRTNVSAGYGAVTLLEGVQTATLNIGNATAGATQTLTFAALNFNTGNVAGGQLLNLNASTSTYIATVAGTTTLAGGGSVVINNAPTLNLNGSIAGAGTKLVKTGAGNLNLVVANTFSGLEILAGTVTLRQGGSQGQGDVTLSGGTLSLINSTATNFLPNNNLVVNGTAAIGFDRVSGTATVGSPFTHTIGSPSNRITFADAVVSFTATQAYTQIAFNAPSTVAKTSVFNPTGSTTFVRFDQAVGGDAATLVKTGAGRINFNAANTFTGTLQIIDGILQGHNAAARFTGVGGRIEILPGGSLVVAGIDNLTNSGGVALFASNSTALAALGMRYVLSSQNDLMTFLSMSNVFSLPGRGGVLLLDGSYNQPLDMSQVYGGDWWIGMSVANAALSGAVTAGSGATYRFAGGGGNLSISTNNVISGVNTVLWGKPNTYNGTLAPVLAGNQNYTGDTFLARGSTIYVRSGNANTALGTGHVDVYGTLEFDGTAGSAVLGADGSLTTGANRNTYEFHPGAILRFDNQQSGNFSTASTSGGRWADGAGVLLNGANLTLWGHFTADTTEVVGALSYQRGASLILARGVETANPSNVKSVTLTAASLARILGGYGTLTVSYGAGLLAAATNFERIMFTAAPTPTGGMLHPSIVSATDGQFLTYDETLGLKLVDTAATATYQSVATASIPASAGAGKILSVGLAGTLAGNLDVYALRTSFAISNGVGNQIRIRSGGLIATGSFTLQPNFYFGDAGLAEALIYTTSTPILTGQIEAEAVVKFGGGGLTIGADQFNFGGPWIVNTGTLTTSTLAGFGTAANTITLNGGATPTLLNFTFDGGSIDPFTYVSGTITAFDNNNIQFNPGVTDRYATIAAIDLQTTASAPGRETTGNRIGFFLPSARNTLTTGMVTLFDDYVINVEASGSAYTMGASSGVVFGGLNNQGHASHYASFVKSGDGVLTLPDISSTFSFAGIYVSQGTLRVTHDGSLGDASVITNVEYGGTLDIAVPNFTPLGQLYFQRGSTERWSVDNARDASLAHVIAEGVTLQLNTNLTTARTIDLMGGTVSGFLRADDDATTVFRTAGPLVTWNLLDNSYVGISLPTATTGGGPIGDIGKFQPLGTPFGSPVIGAILELKGAITETNVSSLTKVGPDTVILSGTNSYTGGTFVRDGVLQIGSSSAIPAAGPIGTISGAVLDLNGYNAAATQLVGTGGTVVNATPAMKTLTLTNPIDAVYAGQLGGRIALLKNGAGTQTLSGTNIHQGTTTVNSGRLLLTGSITQSAVVVKSGGTFELATSGVVGTASSGRITVEGGGTLTGTGTIAGGVTLLDGGKLTTGESVGTLTFTGTATSVLEGGAHLYFDFLNADGDVPGTDWDYFDFGASLLSIAATSSDPIYLHVGARTSDDLGYGANNFDTEQSYSWLFADAGGITTAGGGSLSDRFVIVDSTSGAGVFGEGNPYTIAPGSSFFITELNNGLYLNYAAVPEPGSLLLLALAFGAGLWYQRRRRPADAPPDQLARLYGLVVVRAGRTIAWLRR